MSPAPVTVTTSGILFDLDGTLLTSPEAIKSFWRWYADQEGLNADDLISDMHGRRTIDIIAKYNPKDATKEKCSELEGLIPEKWSHFAKPVPGVHKLLTDLATYAPHNWGVATSGTRRLATGWFKNFLHLPQPELFITAEDVSKGKPDPEPYIEGKKRLHLEDDFLVFEDATAGTDSGKGAGARVVALTTTNTPETLKAHGADFIIKSLESVIVKGYDPKTNKITLEIHPLV